MSKKLKIKQLALASVFLGFTSTTLADNEVSSSEGDKNLSFLKEEIEIIDEFFKNEIAANDHSSTEKKLNSSNGNKNQKLCHSLGDKHPPYMNPNRFVFQGSFIYWKADMDGINYALELDNHFSLTGTITPTTPATSASANQHYKERDLDFEWNPGFKLGIGMIFGDRDEWDLMLRWTWLDSKAHRSRNSGPTPDLTAFFVPSRNEYDLSFQVPGFSPVLSGSPATFSHTNWKLLYNTIDLELGRDFFLAKNLTLRPHLGLRGALLHQRTKVNYDISSTGGFLNPGNGQLGTGAISGSSFFKGTNHYDAIGLRGGLDTRWNFTDHFCTYGQISGAILYGQFKIDEDFSFNGVLNPQGENFSIFIPFDLKTSLDTKIHRTRSTVQALLGVMWHTGFNNDKQHLSIGAAYEVNQWFDQNELRNIVNATVSSQTSSSSGDLGLHGVTVDVVFDF